MAAKLTASEGGGIKDVNNIWDFGGFQRFNTAGLILDSLKTNDQNW